MIKSQKQRLKQSNKVHTKINCQLSIYQLQILNQNISNIFHLRVKSKKSNQIWNTPKFKHRLPNTYTVIIDSRIIEIQLYMEFRKQQKMIASAFICQGADMIFLEEQSKPGSKYCCLRYEIKQKQEISQQKQHFSSNENIFDSYLNGNQVSRIKYKQQKINEQQNSQRIAFLGDHNDITSQILQQNKIWHSKNEKPETNSQKNQQQKQKLVKSFQYERHGFVNYLDDSASFIEDLLNCLPPSDNKDKDIPTNEYKQLKEKLQLPQINEQEQQQNEDQLTTTAQKWYSKKFNKANTKLKLKRKQSQIQKAQSYHICNNNNNIRIIIHDNSFIENDEIVRQLSEFVTEKNIRLKSIDFSLLSEQSSEKGRKLCSILRSQNIDSNLLNATVILPSKGAILVECNTDSGKVNGCMGLAQLKKGECQLFNQTGEQCGLVYFKYKTISNFVMQTQEILNMAEQSQDGQQVKQLDQQLSNNINTNHQSPALHNQMLNSVAILNNNKLSNQLQKQGNSVPNSNQEVCKINDENKYDKLHSITNQQQQRLQIQKLNLDAAQVNTEKMQNLEAVLNKKTYEIEKQCKFQNQLKDEHQISQKIQQSQLCIEKNIIPKSSSKINIPSNDLPYLNRAEDDGNQNKTQNAVANNNKPVQNRQQNSQQKKHQKIIQGQKQKEYKQKQKFQLMRKIKQNKMKKFLGFQLTIQPSKNSNPQQQTSPLIQSSQVTLPINLNKYNLESNNKLHKNRVTLSDYNEDFLNDHHIFQQEHVETSQKRKRQTYFGNIAGSRHSKEIKIPFFTLDPMQTNSGDSVNMKNYRNRLNESEVSKISKLSSRDNINLKIFSIHVNLHRPSYNGKIIKMRVDKNIYFTQTSKQLYFLTWKGKGYFFPNISKNSILTIQLIQEKDNSQQKLGICKIHIPFLKTDEISKILQYDDFIRSQNQQSVGRLILNYEIVEKRGKSLQIKNNENIKVQKLKIELDQQNKFERYSTLQKRNRKIKTNRYATQDSRADERKSTISTNRIPTGIGKNEMHLHSNILSRLNKHQPPLTKRKYIGGNILIPKASRFKEDQTTRYLNDPGPGAYEMVSGFDSHASPL